MNAIKKVAVLLTAAAALTLTGCGSSGQITHFNGWVDGCTAFGGHVSPTSFGYDGPEWWECFKDDEIVQVPGFDNSLED